MRPGRLLRTSARALLAHRVRALLAASSVAVGVAAVLVTDAVGAGAQAELSDSLASMGTNLLTVRPVEVPRSVARRELRGAVTSLVLEDHEAISRLPHLLASVPGASATARVTADGEAVDATVLGTTPAFLRARSFRLRSGRFLDPDDDHDARRVAVIGARVAEQLFEGQEPTGRALRLRGVPYDVIGVLAAKGVLADGSDEDKLVVVPLRTALRRVLNITWLDTVFVSVERPELLARTEDALRALLRERHRLRPDEPDDFSIQDKTKAVASQRETVAFLSLLTTGLASLALLVGGTGILALLLLGVRERRVEIGLRVALGATPRDVFAQFLAEAAALAASGWVIGLLAGAAAAAVVAFATGWRVEASPWTALASFAATVITGLMFGSVPARRASLVPPILALTSR